MAAAGQLRAMQAASQLLDELGVDKTHPVDPFAALDELGLEVRFDKWDGMLGAILPTDPPHVLINNTMPGSVQRFTAAHEIGHYLLHADELAVDLDSQINGVENVQLEREAQTFAASFLMPLDLLYEVASRYEVESKQPISADQIYAMARDMHVSYAAAVHQLANARFFSAAARARYLKTRPAALKRDLANGGELANPRGDVWLFDGSVGDLEVEVFSGDEIIVMLPENPTTGYTWDPALISWSFEQLSPQLALVGGDDDDEASSLPVPIVQDSFEPVPNEESRVGAGGFRRVGIWARQPGEYRVGMRNARPFEPEEDSLEQGLLAHVRPDPQGEMKARYLADFRVHEREVTYIDPASDDA